MADEYERLLVVVAYQDSVIAVKENTIQQLAKTSKVLSNRINELTSFIKDSNQEIDDISKEEIKIASNLFSRLTFKVEADTDVSKINDFRLRGRLTYDIKKVYIFTVGQSELNKFNLRAGIGLKIF